MLEQIRKNGYVRARIDGEIRDLSEEIVLEKNKKHFSGSGCGQNLFKSRLFGRLADSLETVSILARVRFGRY